MAKRKKTPLAPRARRTGIGEMAEVRGRTLKSYRLGAVPIIARLLKRLRLERFLHDFLCAEDVRLQVPPPANLLVLLQNLLISREPLYGVGEWARRYAPDLFGLSPVELARLNDDRVGRDLDRLFCSDVPSLALAVATHAVREFGVQLDELHNDSTTITFHGAYSDAKEEKRWLGGRTLAITWGHNKDHRPDLKQLLYILTVAKDGGVPVHFRVESGNVADDQTHRATWDLLCQLTGKRDFLYVADCKLATAENMAHVHQNGGKFLTVLPRTRREDSAFQERVSGGNVRWRPIYDKVDEVGEVLDRYSVCEGAATSAEGYRLVWYHSARKAELDALTRSQRLERAVHELGELRQKLASPRSRYRDHNKVQGAVAKILEDTGVADWIVAEIQEHTQETYRQDRRGRPGPKTRYVKQERARFDLEYRIDHERLAAEATGDGIFPLITNELSMSERDLLLAYKGQPTIEKRFSQLKTDFEVAPVFLKGTRRVQALLVLYFFALLTEALLERELRRAMQQEGVESLPLYPEGRPCTRPTARRVIDLFEDVQRHELLAKGRAPIIFRTDLTPLERKILKLLRIPRAYEP